MKTIKVALFAVVGTFLFTTSANAQTAKAQAKAAQAAITTSPATPKPTSPVKWKEETHDFGDIKKGTPVSHDFTFTNTTKQIVLITNVQASCGCTATNYTKTPIKPGETANVTATYNAASAGAFSKTVTVTLNENETPKTLVIKGKVIEDATN